MEVLVRAFMRKRGYLPAVPAAAAGCLAGLPMGTIKAEPEVAVAGVRGLGSTKLVWTSRFTDAVEVRVGAPDGPLLSRTGPRGEAVTGQWVHDGMAFYLQSVSSGSLLTSDGTLDMVKVRVVSAACDLRSPAARALADVLERLLSARLFRGVEKYLQRCGIQPGVGKVRFGDLRRVTPVSWQWGGDRGKPVDRYYIENFLAGQAQDVYGVVLEFGEDLYTQRYGGGRVVKSDVLSLEPNPTATIIADLTTAEHLPSETYDCIVLTQVLQYIYDFRAALRTLHRILRPGGVLLCTVPGISYTDWQPGGSTWCWSFTPRSVGRMLGEFFPETALEVQSYGNVLAAASFLYGLGEEELTKEELDYSEPGYEVTITVRAVKPGDQIQ